MDTALIALLAGCLVLAALLYYVNYVHPQEPTGHWGKSGLINLMLVLVPVLVIALWFQDGAEDRLAELGLTPYPGFVSSSGVATGAGESPVWVFSVEGDPEQVLAFYRRAENRAGWSLHSESGSLLLLEKEGRLLSVAASPGSVAIMVRPGE